MLVNVHTTTRFWFLQLATELERRGLLGHYLTTEPATIARRGGLPANRIRSLGYLRMYDYVCTRMGRPSWIPSEWMGRHYASRSAALVGQCDLLVHISGKALAALRKGREAGVVTVTSHGNTHVLTQDAWVREACEQAGLEPRAYSLPQAIENARAEYEMADYIEVPTRLCAESFVEHGLPPGKLLVNPFPVDTEYWNCAEKPDPNRELRFLFAGSIQVRKGVATLLEAWKRAKPERAGLYFSISGIWDHMQPVLSRYEGLFTVLKPFANQATFRARINDYHVLVLPSFEEGFSFALAQGMSCGLAPLCSDRTGGQEVLTPEQDGLLFKAGDVQALEAAIRRLCHERELWQHLGANARQVCLRQLTPRHYGDRAVANYRRVLAEKGKLRT